MRTFRGLYVTLVYILALPGLTIGAMVLMFKNINHPIQTFKAWLWGMKLSHKSNMAWVKTGQRS